MKEGSVLRAYDDGIRDGLYMGIIIDGQPPARLHLDNFNTDAVYLIADGLENTTHELTIYKRNDAIRGYCDFKGLIVEKDAELFEIPPATNRRIECFGDSVSAGCVIEFEEYAGRPDPENHGEGCNPWYSYINIVAERLGAELHNNSQGGLPFINGYGYFNLPVPVGLEFTYDKLRYAPYVGGLNDWDFSRFILHLVVIAIGQNDGSTFYDISKDSVAK